MSKQSSFYSTTNPTPSEFDTAQTLVNEATAAANSAIASATSATSSATNASNSATSASGSAATATTQATNASNSATAAATSASSAATSATNSASSATASASSASSASTSATNASNSATAAATSATNAANSATAAATSATNAAASAASAASVVAGALQKSNNLNDVTSVSTARTNLGLGTAATLNVGTAANNIPQLDASGFLPAVNGSALTNLNASNVASGTLAVARGGTGTGTAATQGQVFYAGASGVHAGSNNYVWDATNNRLGIGTNAPAVSLAVNGSDAILVPVGNTSARPTATAGYIRYNSDTSSFEGSNGSTWASVGGGATGGGSDTVFWVNGQTVNSSYSIPSNYNAGTFGPVTIGSSATVTIPSTSVWTII